LWYPTLRSAQDGAPEVLALRRRKKQVSPLRGFAASSR
jgi:hypothetical protein